MWILHVLPVYASDLSGFSGFSGFLPQFKVRTGLGWLEALNWPVGVNVRVIGRRPVPSLSIGSLKWIKREMMDERDHSPHYYLGESEWALWFLNWLHCCSTKVQSGSGRVLSLSVVASGVASGSTQSRQRTLEISIFCFFWLPWGQCIRKPGKEKNIRIIKLSLKDVLESNVLFSFCNFFWLYLMIMWLYSLNRYEPCLPDRTVFAQLLPVRQTLLECEVPDYKAGKTVFFPPRAIRLVNAQCTFPVA